MVSRNIKSSFLLFVIFSASVFLQENPIETKQKELDAIKSEISTLQKQLDQKSKKEKESSEALENINKQNYLLNKLISSLRKEEREKESEIRISSRNISQLETEIKNLKENYTRYVVSIYKHGKFSEWESVFDSKTFNQALLRIKYLREFSNRRQNDLQNYEIKKNQLVAAKTKLEREKAEKRALVNAKEKEEKSLDQKISEQTKIISAIKKDKKNLNKKINDKRKAENQIKDLITKLVEEAERKREEELKSKTVTSTENKNVSVNSGPVLEYDVDLNTGKFSSFAELKGRLAWPVAKGKIVRKFGEQRNNRLNTLTVNYGIDIQCSGELSVKSVADGVVSAIEWLPGYGTVIIVSHKGGYRTVYGHLAEIFVGEGDKLKTGSLVGKVGESLEGKILHFEIWKDRETVNPETWLKK